MRKNLKRKVVLSVFFAGLFLLAYPFISKLSSKQQQKIKIEEYMEIVAEKVMQSAHNGEPKSIFEEEWEKARAYNESLLPQYLPQAFVDAENAEEPNEQYVSCLNITGDGMMGYIKIPKIDVKVAIYHSSNAQVLKKAAGHIEGSSLPVGGESTHAIISAHRGLATAELFSELGQLVVGDSFTISVLDKTLYYEVDQIVVVEPSNVDFLKIEEGKDYVTLMTCTPYGVNTHRLLVRGCRVQEATEES